MLLLVRKPSFRKTSASKGVATSLQHSSHR